MNLNKDELTLSTFIQAQAWFKWFDTTIKPGRVTLNNLNMVTTIYHGTRAT